MITGRLVVGIAMGLTTVIVPIYFIETPPPPYRGILSSSFYIMGTTTGFLAYCLALTVPNKLAPGETSNTWRILLSLSIIPAALRTINLFIFFRNDTPGYYLSCNKVEEARKSIAKIYKEGVDQRLEELIKEREFINSRGKVSFRELFTKKYRRALGVCLVLATVPHMAGLKIVLIYAQTIFRYGVTDPKSNLPKYLAMALTGIGMCLSPFVACTLSRFKRRTLLIPGTFFTGVILMIFATIQLTAGAGSIAAKVVYLFWPLPFSFSLSSTAIIMVPETLPEIGVSLAILGNWTMSFLTTQFFPDIVDGIGFDETFILMGSICFVATLFFWKFVVETKGKSKTQILQEYSGIKEVKKPVLEHTQSLTTVGLNKASSETEDRQGKGEGENQNGVLLESEVKLGLQRVDSETIGLRKVTSDTDDQQEKEDKLNPEQVVLKVGAE
jgi:SP family arabinose:H+ symporter-like MFS transporter